MASQSMRSSEAASSARDRRGFLGYGLLGWERTAVHFLLDEIPALVGQRNVHRSDLRGKSDLMGSRNPGYPKGRGFGEESLLA